MLRSIWLWLVGTLVGLLVVVRSLFFRSVRVNRQTATALYEMVQQEGRTFVLHEEIAKQKLPAIYDAVCWLGSWFPFRLRIEERMLRAGFASTDSVTTITALRWQIKPLLTRVESNKEQEDINVYLLQPWDADRIGSLDDEEIAEPYMTPSIYRALEADVAHVVAGDKRRTSALLHGPPGNGKSYLSRYLALKYRLPVYIVALRPGHDNHEIIRMFSYLKGPAVVVMEDFDGYFKGRERQLENCKFTFDVILNVLDGTYASMNGTIVLMTCNDLDNVDDALKRRPGRLRHVLEIPNPDAETVERIFAEHGLPVPADVDGRSLDELLALRDTLLIENVREKSTTPSTRVIQERETHSRKAAP